MPMDRGKSHNDHLHGYRQAPQHYDFVQSGQYQHHYPHPASTDHLSAGGHFDYSSQQNSLHSNAHDLLSSDGYLMYDFNQPSAYASTEYYPLQYHPQQVAQIDAGQSLPYASSSFYANLEDMSLSDDHGVQDWLSEPSHWDSHGTNNTATHQGTERTATHNDVTYIDQPCSSDHHHDASQQGPTKIVGKYSRSVSRRRSTRNVDSPWASYSDHDKKKILHILHLYTGMQTEAIANRVRSKFTDEMKAAVLSGEEAKIEEVGNTVFPLMAKGFRQQMWMKNMSMDDSIRVVKKMAKASGKDPEYLRSFFRMSHLEERRAMEILHASSEKECKRLVMLLGLDRPNERKIKKGNSTVTSKTIEVWPWMKWLNDNERSEVIAKMRRLSGLGEKECYRLLQKSPAQVEKFGFTILDMSDGETVDLVRSLQESDL
ncbi:hypothetical protein CBS101457_000075 [Exobasidium rhododendri]|nr:hypothetical protein CBS101457_000075 [Exobasidium rhododendri]